jgi:membrane protein implicated in regulation of membrane protease activity
MTEIGWALVVLGTALLVVEAHVAGGVIGVFGGMALAAGAAFVIGGAGGGIALVVAAMIAAVAVTGVWIAIATRKSLTARRRAIASGAEALCGHRGVVRSWNGEGGQVFVDGALWRARLSPIDEGDRLDAGDAVVVERVSGLTLAVRKAEDWEDHW